MRTFVFAATLVLVTLVALPVQAAADTVSVGKLLSEPTSFDGKQITISGELIGDYGFRSDGTVWAQLNFAREEPCTGRTWVSASVQTRGSSWRSTHRDATTRSDRLSASPAPGNTTIPIAEVKAIWRWCLSRW